jgi:hypothetical protein
VGETDNYQAVALASGALQIIENLPGKNVSRATAVSDDGRVIVGYGGIFDESNPDQFLDPEAFVWTAERGTQTIRDVFADSLDFDTILADWKLTHVWDVSDDGTTLVGQAAQPDGRIEAWRIKSIDHVAEFPAPIDPDFDSDGQVTASDIDFLFAAIRRNAIDDQFDLNRDGKVDSEDARELIENVLNTSFGDSNLDGIFDSSDLVAIFQRGEYEDTVEGNSTWSEGDWNGDGDFNTSDLVIAFAAATYVRG